MPLLKNNKGIALVTALLFTLISLGIVMALLTIVSQGTRVSAANKTYKTAIAAGYGGIDLVARDILPAIFKGNFDSGYNQNLADSISLTIPAITFPISETPPFITCFNQKIGSPTALWTACGGTQATTLVPSQSPDMTFILKAANDPAGFKVYAKITDTRCGGDTAAGQPCTNSDGSSIIDLDTGGGVASATGTVTPQHRPAYYRLEVQSERANNPKEKSEFSVYYGY